MPDGGQRKELDENRELHQLLSEASFEAIVIHDEGTILAVNPAFAQMFGYGMEEVLGKSGADMAAPESQEVLLQNIQSKQEEVFRAVGMKKDGSRFPVEVRGKGVRFRDRRVRVAVIRDLTGRLDAEKAIRNLEDRVMKLIEGVPAAVLVADVNGKPRYANDFAMDLLGRTPMGPGLDVRSESFAESMQLYESGKEHLYPSGRSPLVRAFAGETSTVDDMEIRRSDRTMPVEVSAAPVYDDDGEISYVVAVLRDITRRREVESALKTAEAKYRNIFENAIDGIFQSTPSGRFLTVNPAMARIWGYDSPEEMIEDIDNIQGRYARPSMRSEFKRLMSERGMVMGFEAEMIRKDGSVMWTYVNARTVLGDDGEISYYEGTIEDITARKMAEKCIIESESRYRTLVETSPDAIGMIDIDLKVTTANKQAAEMFGYDSSDEMIGLSVLPIIGPTDYSVTFDEIVSASRTVKGISAEYTLLRRNGTRFPAEVSVAVVPGSEGRPSAFITIVRDIMGRKRDEEALHKVNAELDGYAHTVSHDLRNPLAAIILASETLEALLKAPESDEMRGYVNEIIETIQDSAKRATDLIEDLLVLAEAGQASKEIEDVDVADVVETILDEMATEISDRGVTIELDEGLGTLRANPTQVYQVFSNLVGNAIMHNDSDEPCVRVSRLADADSGGRRFRVRDNGSGIPEDVLGSVFMPFIKGAGGHTGIGLTIVEKIVKAYNGEVEAHNDNGAVFEVTFREI